MKTIFLSFLLFFLTFPALAVPEHAVAMHGSVKYPENFSHFDYVNPDAPKGGVLRLSAFGSYDTFNPFVIKGVPAAGVSMLFDTLTVDTADEPFSEYGLIAESIDMPADRSRVTFRLRPQARFHDGTPVTAEDVVFSFNLLREKGAPAYRAYYSAVASVKAVDKHRVVFKFLPGDNRELPLILGQLPVLPKHYFSKTDFSQTTLVPPVGSGPYKIKSFDAGRHIVYERVKDYWATDLPVRKGFNNFDEIRFDYYRDTTVAVEAFKSGAFDIRQENEAKKWISAYNDWPALNNGLVLKKEFGHRLPQGMQGYVFNLRRPLFSNRLVRQALGLAFDFNWSNKSLFYGLYRRTNSYFDNSELASTGLPDSSEQRLLRPYRSQLPKEVFEKPFLLPQTDATGHIRPQLTEAFSLLKQAGWTVQNGVLTYTDGTPFSFEILLDSTSASAWERITLPFINNLKRLGIQAKIRTVDPTQYKNRTDNYDFDVIVMIWGQSMSPGNEQSYFWGSETANMPGGYNLAGIDHPVIDALIKKIISARDRKSLVSATKALDRVLLWQYYVIPHWHSPVHRYVFWNKFGMPDIVPEKGLQMMTWWYDDKKDELVQKEIKSKNRREESSSLYQKLKKWF